MLAEGEARQKLDVAVVGGGIAGVYCAWRLQLEAGERFNVTLYESSNRIGGRLLSVKAPGIPDSVVELGGMRFTSGHTRLRSLLDQLRLAYEPFPVHEPQNIAYLRGRRLRCQDLSDPAAISYNLLPDERCPSAAQEGFVALAARRVLRAALNKDVRLTAVDWQAVKAAKFAGEPLTTLPLRYVLQRSISDEALRFADDASGYNSVMTTWNAYNGLRWNRGEFGLGLSYFHLVQGFAQLPREMCRQLSRRLAIPSTRGSLHDACTEQARKSSSQSD